MDAEHAVHGHATITAGSAPDHKLDGFLTALGQRTRGEHGAEYFRRDRRLWTGGDEGSPCHR